ncbi:MAG: hypothetical protein COW88_03495 [Candidatus Lloydbacteria bacterium CG22_combo_CG10-13_8_21_14_all_47_15]|uniref:Response regulatory domain-containing protein n=1 Tax=Candidatus Lloydbacteria bacterium CG22_combo_CG10-13_8_21_14_all_47_15 TaxID=1974635 RepID=A0A2H0CTL8_9BACT|nr:MAG: hypothetical protein COW88_03495 [Candidatus Lloydbacteria bacterium CG22_combo_CG10-13_8_21_14_all_47_15]
MFISAKRKNTIIVVGNSGVAKEFATEFHKKGLDVIMEETPTTTLKTAKTKKPDAIIFVLPEHWHEITDFVENIRDTSELVDIPIVYIGSKLEGFDQKALKEYGVHTFTMGPIPIQEVVRYTIQHIK